MSVELQNVAVDYGSVRVLQPCSLSVREGEFLTILGPSGSGKTTILRVIGGFMRPSEGRVLLQGKDVTSAPAEKRPVNTVFQDYALFPHMSVAQNVEFSLTVKKVERRTRRLEAERALELVGLSGFGNRPVNRLSGGQRQRVALARAIVAKPSVILLDEPLSALDAELRHQMQLFLKSIQKQLGTTFLLVTHDQEEALAVSDRVVVMSQGRIQQIGSCEQIYNEPDNEFVARFIGRSNLFAVNAVGADGGVKTSIGTFKVATASCSEGLAGNSQHLAVRPEKMWLGTLSKEPEQVDVNEIVGVVRDVAFAGSRWRYAISAKSSPDILINVDVAASVTYHYAPGDEVRAMFHPDDGRIVASPQ